MPFDTSLSFIDVGSPGRGLFSQLLDIADAFGCRTKTVENIRQRLVEKGFRETLDGKKRSTPPTAKILDGEQEARIIATRLGPPPKGYANWSLRLLARKVVELEIVDTVSYSTLCRTLKKTA